MTHGEPVHGSELRRMLRDGALLARASAQEARDMEQNEVLTLAEVAKLLRVERHQVRKLIERGLPYKRIGSRYRFLRREVIAWLLSQKEDA
jgi:excisionase family DNA binding protein